MSGRGSRSRARGSQGRLRHGAAVRAALAAVVGLDACRGLRDAAPRTGQCTSVRLVPRGGAGLRHHGNGEGGACRRVFGGLGRLAGGSGLLGARATGGVTCAAWAARVVIIGSCRAGPDALPGPKSRSPAGVSLGGDTGCPPRGDTLSLGVNAKPIGDIDHRVAIVRELGSHRARRPFQGRPPMIGARAAGAVNPMLRFPQYPSRLLALGKAGPGSRAELLAFSYRRPA